MTRLKDDLLDMYSEHRAQGERILFSNLFGYMLYVEWFDHRV